MVFFACFLLVLQALLLTLILADSVEVMEIKRDPVPESLIADMEDDYYMIGPEFFATSVCPDPDDISGMDIAPDTRDMDMVRDSYNMTAHEASIGASALGMAAVSFVGKPEHKGAYIVPKGWHQSVRYWNQICWWGRAGKRDKCWAHKSCRFEVFIRNYSQESQVSPRDSTCGLGLLDNLRGECNCEVHNWICWAFEGEDGTHGIWAQFSIWPWRLSEAALAAIPRAVRKATAGEEGMEEKVVDCCAWGDSECFNDLNFPGLIHPPRNNAWDKAMKKIVTCLYYDCPRPSGPPRLLAIGA